MRQRKEDRKKSKTTSSRSGNYESVNELRDRVSGGKRDMSEKVHRRVKIGAGAQGSVKMGKKV